LMPWQRHVADVALELESTVDMETGEVVERLAYREIRLTVPRQSGKTTLMLAAMAHRCIAMGDRQRVSYSAQTGKDARLKWEDEHIPVLERSPFAQLMKVRKTNGSEAIRWANGSLWSLLATTETAGHGAQLDLGVIDEAFALQDDRLEQAMKPAMVTRTQPQLWIVSTAGTNDSLYLNDKIDDGRLRAAAGQTSSVAYFEWSAPDDAKIDDENVWRACMPALGITVPIEAIRSDFASMREPEFRRAYLNQRQDRMASQPWQVISEDLWVGCIDEGSQIDGGVSVALDVTPSRSMSSLSAAGLRADGKVHVELIGNRPGTSWVLDWFAQNDRVGQYKSVIVDPVSAAGSMAGDLRRLGLQVVEISSRDMATACGKFFDLVVDGSLVHINQVPLNAAVAGAKRRKLGDAWAWHRRDTSTDVSPLVSSTIALLGVISPVDPVGVPAIVDPWMVADA
jgi:phage terminase large subunit-like protein